MAVISTGNHPAALWPGVHKFWGMEYNRYPQLFSQMFEVVGSTKAYEEDVEATTFGLAPVKSEGSAITYDAHVQGETKRYTHTAYALGYIVTYEELSDNQYASVSMSRARSLAFSMVQSKETVGAQVYNRAANSSFTGGDGKELLATDHPSTIGDQSNELATAADISEAAIEDIVIQMRKAKNDRGLRINLMPQKLIIPPDLEFDANRILKSVLQNDTANNAVNALRSTGSIPEIFVNPFLTDADQWFVRTNCPAGMMHFAREAPTMSNDNDHSTKNALASCYERYSFGWTDWRGVFGSPGA